MKTFGVIRYNAGKSSGLPVWVLDAEPQVMMKAKRIFPRATGYSPLLISDTLEVCRDLLWFVGRYAMRYEPKSAEAFLKQRAAQHVDHETLVAELMAGIRPYGEFELAVPLRNYQKQAVALLLLTKSLLLIDDLGIGKTATAIGTFTDPRTLPALVVTMTSLPLQWEREVKKFAPGLRAHIIKSTRPYAILQATRSHGHVMPDVIITSYSKLSAWAYTLAPLIRSVIFDEIQELRRGKSSDKGTAASHLVQAAEFRLGLTATPIYNLGSEMFNIVEAVRPGALGTKDEFSREWCSGDTNDRRSSSIKNPEAFGTHLRAEGIMLRRTRADVQIEVPPLTTVLHTVNCDIEELDKVEESATALARLILSDQQQGKAEKFRAAGDFDMLLRQATGVAKARYVAEFVRIIVESDEPVLLFGWHRRVYEIWLERLKNLKPAMFTGTESVKEKEAARAAFCEGKTKLLIMSLRSGAGLDGLQHHCRTVIYGELDWSPGVHEQDTCRIYRPGQKDPVTVYYPVTDHGSDPMLIDLLGLKRQQIEGIRDPKREVTEVFDAGGGHQIKKLAAEYLKRLGKSKLGATG